MKYTRVEKELNARKTYKDRKASDLYINLSHGNKKLRQNARVAFLIWNLPAVMTCPFRTVNCERSCYALKAEKMYPDALPSRMNHFNISRCDDFVERMIYTIQVELDRPKHKNRKIVFRIHESGDFYNKIYADKWLEIARHFENNTGIVFVAYTKSVRYFDGVDLPTNLSLLASVWDDTSAENLEVIRRNNFRIYTAFNKDAMYAALASGYSFCPCKDCGTCGKCWNNFINNVACEIH